MLRSSHDNQPSALLPGMIVRFPVDIDDDPTNFREFRLGHIDQITYSSATAVIRALIYDLSESEVSREVSIVAAEHSFERPLDQLVRCRVMADSSFRSVTNPSASGRVLATCEACFPDGQFLYYFVQIDGRIQRLSEADIWVGSTRQDTDPVTQALGYELQNPSWRQPRDRIVEAYGELRNSTFGIEDLVGSRVFLMAHQAEVIARVLSSPDCRFMLADEVGLGKTIEACVILKALRRREPGMQTLIIAPASLTHQWRNELNKKFWLDLPIVQPALGQIHFNDHPGLIISTEDLAEYQACWDTLSERSWDLLIVDEAHQLRKSQKLYHRVCLLSKAAQRVLILTATPIQRHAEEYLSLLKVLDPRRYGSESLEAFHRLLDAQQPIRTAITLAQPLLDTDDVEVEELLEELEPLKAALYDDAVLAGMLADLAAMEDSISEARDLARQIVAYVSANYRIESRMIRNRRANLQITLPQRTLDTSYSYKPAHEEERLLEDLYDYAQRYLSVSGATPLAVEYVRALLHSSASSPQAFCELLRWREESLRCGDKLDTEERALLSPAAPRQEAHRLHCLAASAPVPNSDLVAVVRLARQAEHWREQSDRFLAAFRLSSINQPSTNRLAQCLRAIYAAVDGHKNAKVLVFTNWAQTAELITCRLKPILGHGAVEQFIVGMTDTELQVAADRFQSNDECCVLVCDELGGEGRNFQIADCIIHVDIPWTPTQVEQRIGRVDRLGRTDAVCSIPLFARNTVEHDLFRLWDEGLGLFTRSMSGMEIALESTQDQLAAALGRSVRQGVADLLDPIQCQSAALREEVEKECLYEKEADNKELRQQFTAIDERYRDGSVIRAAVAQWTSMAGLSNFRVQGDMMIYEARNFRLNAMRKARFLPPSMIEATKRLGNQRTTQIVGTFSRDLAVRREDLVFFAPGDDPWTDAVITNALECDRGRCCAVGFHCEHGADTPFFELLYSFQINPRMLYEAQLDPIYLLHAQSYLARPNIRLLVDIEGATIQHSDPRWQLIKLPFKVSPLTHLGERKKTGRDGVSALERFRERYPADVWSDLVRSCVAAAEQFIQRDVIEYAAERAGDAERELGRRVAGWEAGLRWQASNGGDVESERSALEQYRRACQALVTGICSPITRLESICFWDTIEVRQ